MKNKEHHNLCIKLSGYQFEHKVLISNIQSLKQDITEIIRLDYPYYVRESLYELLRSYRCSLHKIENKIKQIKREIFILFNIIIVFFIER